MYGLTIIPSAVAMPFIYVVKAFVSDYLYVDMVFKVLGLGFHPAKESFNWTIDNWWSFSFRRCIVDWLLTPMYFFT